MRGCPKDGGDDLADGLKVPAGFQLAAGLGEAVGALARVWVEPVKGLLAADGSDFDGAAGEGLFVLFDVVVQARAAADF